LADFWTSEVLYWRSFGEKDSKAELQGIGNAMLCGNPSIAHRHMKMWFDKIQVASLHSFRYVIRNMRFFAQFSILENSNFRSRFSVFFAALF
jgi:hypothetical protein